MSSQRRKKRYSRRPDNYISKTIGLVLSGIQVAATIVFMIVLAVLDMLPAKYFASIRYIVACFLWNDSGKSDFFK